MVEPCLGQGNLAWLDGNPCMDGAYCMGLTPFCLELYGIPCSWEKIAYWLLDRAHSLPCRQRKKKGTGSMGPINPR
uniref:Uncharacterized protein n=1 Tax=Picea glauca TaxID=3330 RepID=A0A101M0L1_PICGL|nr:hypothetical protein ABT39_MTgene4737 [Picea glauca]